MFGTKDPVPTMDMQTLPPLSSLGAMIVQKGRFGRSKIKLSSKNTKSIISQKIRIAQKKLFKQKMSARSIPIYRGNLTTFEES